MIRSNFGAHVLVVLLLRLIGLIPFNHAHWIIHYVARVNGLVHELRGQLLGMHIVSKGTQVEDAAGWLVFLHED